jgi:hypothetical protein
MEINTRHGDESEAAHRLRKPLWLGIVAIVIAIAAVLALMARTGVGPGPVNAPLATQPTPVQSVAVPSNGLPKVNLPPVAPSTGAQPANLNQNGGASE